MADKMDESDQTKKYSDDKVKLSMASFRKVFSKKQMSTNLASLERMSQRIRQRLSSGSIGTAKTTEDNLVPREITQFTIEYSEDCLTEFFSRVGRDVIIHGQMLLIGKDMLAANDALAYHCGVLLSPGLLLLYTVRIDGSAITFTYITGLSLANAAVSLEHNIIIIKSKTESHIKIQDNTKIKDWYDKLSMYCEAGQTSETPSPVKIKNNKLRSTSFDGFASKMRSQMKSVRKQYNVPDVISNITTNSWYTEDNFLSNNGSRNAQFSTISEDNVVIDETFFLISRVWGRVLKTGDELSQSIFTKMLVSLNKDCFYLQNHKKQLKIDMNKFDLTSTERMKWCIRIGNDGITVDIKLDSKENYEIWSLAFLKMFKRNEENLCKKEKEQKQTLSSCLPMPLPLECESEASRFTFEPIVNEEASDYSNDQPNGGIIRRSINDDVFVSNSCYRKRISEYSAVYSSKNHRNSEICDCTFTAEFAEEDDIQIPLPIRCEKRTIAQKLKKSCHILSHFVPRPYDLKRIEIFNSKRTKSELDLSTKSPKQFTKNTNNKRTLFSDSNDVSRITKSYNDLRLETIMKQENEDNHSNNKSKIQNPNMYSEEHIYEEPISSKDRNKSQ